MLFTSMIFVIETLEEFLNIYMNHLFLYGLIYYLIMNHIIILCFYMVIVVKLLEKFFFSLICNFPESCNLSLQEFFFFFQFKVDFIVLLNNNMGCLVHGSIFYPKKKTCILVSTLFYLGGVFGVFFAKIIIFMGRVLVHSI